jgi:hypothetical protein
MAYDSGKMSNLKVLLEDTPEVYYWVGFLLADGSLRKNGRFQLSVAIKDKQHLEKFAKFIDCPVHTYFVKLNNKEYPQCEIRIMDKKWAKAFSNKFDFSHIKTITPPKNLKFETSDLFLSLFIGFIDGDGCINKQSGRQDCILRVKVHSSWQSTLQNWINILYSFITIETKHWVIPQVTINNQGYAQFAIANSDVLKFLKYSSNRLQLPRLERKWNKIDLKYSSRYIKSDLRKLQIIKFAEDGILSQKDIAKAVGVVDSYVSRILKRGINHD